MLENNCKKKAKHAAPTLDAKKNFSNGTLHVPTFWFI